MSTTEPLIWELHDDVPVMQAGVVDEGLGAANQAAAPLHQVQALSCFVRQADGTVIGGAVGRTWGLCCELQQLWVEPAQRRHGIGALLVNRFEQHAVSRGCSVFYLDTFSFQAPAFYRALGYQPLLTIEGFAPGIAKHMMLKRLAVEAPSAAR